MKTAKAATDNPNCAINDGECSAPGGTIVTLPDTGERVCNTHYQRWYRLGDARASAKRGTRKSEIEEWVAAMVAADDGKCWPWPFNTYTPEHSPGYGSFGMWRSTTAHRAILLLVAGPPPEPGMFACHKSTCTERPLCVAPWHLYWGTAKDNAADMAVDGTRPQGESHYHSLLTEAQAKAVIADSRPYGEIAAECGVTKRVISDIKQGRTWKHLDRSAATRGHRSKVTEEMALAIIPDPRSQDVIAREWGIGAATVHGIKHGTYMPHLDRSNVVIHSRGGEQSPLTEDDVLDIISDPRNYAAIALTYGMSETAVRNIKKGITWKHIDRSGLVDPQRPRGRPKGSGKVYRTIDDGQAMMIILDPRPLMAIARDFGVSTDTVRRVKRGDLFSHLDRTDVVVNRPGRHRKAGTRERPAPVRPTPSSAERPVPRKEAATAIRRVTEEMAMAIISDPRPQHEIAAEYGISASRVSNIKTGVIMPELDRSGVVRNKKGGPKSDLDEEKVLAILADHRPYLEIAAEYGVSERAIYNIKRGRTWKQVDRSGLVRYAPGGGRHLVEGSSETAGGQHDVA